MNLSPDDVKNISIICLNDPPNGLHHGNKPVIYADYTSVLLTANSEIEVKSKMNNALD